MRVRGLIMPAAVASALALAPGEARAATAESCVDSYLSCINVASQESGWFWRTAKETECGLEYYGCMRRKAAGS